MVAISLRTNRSCLIVPYSDVEAMKERQYEEGGDVTSRDDSKRDLSFATLLEGSVTSPRWIGSSDASDRLTNEQVISRRYSGREQAA